MNCLRRSALVWLAGGLVAIVSLEASADGIWSFPEGILSPDLEVVQDGKSDYVVVVAADAIPRRHIRRQGVGEISQADDGRQTGDRQGRRTAAGREIVIGPTNKRLLLMGLDAPLGAWNDDEFWIVTKGKRLVLIGDRPFGALYAVYEFLEMRGFRFLAPDVAEDSKSPKLAVPPLDECHAPAFQGRGGTPPRHPAVGQRLGGAAALQ